MGHRQPSGYRVTRKSDRRRTAPPESASRPAGSGESDIEARVSRGAATGPDGLRRAVGRRPVDKPQLIPGALDHDPIALLVVPFEQGEGERVLEPGLDDPLEGAGT